MMFIPIALTVFSSAAYHFMLKEASSRQSPLQVLFWAYLAASVLCLIVLFATKTSIELLPSIKDKGYLPFLLAFAIVGLEVGYIFSYRGGGKLGQVTMFTQMISLMLMMALGYFIMKEPMTFKKLLGVLSAFMTLMLLRP